MLHTLEIREVLQLSAEETRRLYGWGDNIFGTAGLDITYRTKEGLVRFLLYAGADEPVSHAAVLRHHARANGSAVLIGGIGGVVTVPEAQRRGYAAMVVRHAINVLRDRWAVDFALLFCVDRMVDYYQRLGFREVRCEVLIDQPAGKAPCPFHVMTLPFNPQVEVIDSLSLGSAPW